MAEKGYTLVGELRLVQREIPFGSAKSALVGALHQLGPGGRIKCCHDKFRRLSVPGFS